MMKKVLLVIDMQNDYLWEKRKKRFIYDTADLVAKVNSVIDKYYINGCDVVYVRQIFQNLWTNRVLLGFSIAGTEGANLYKGLKIVSGSCFEKMMPDAFSSSQFREFIKNNGYDTAAICGIDECGCVYATAMGALKNGLKAEIISDAVGTNWPAKRDKFCSKLKKAGAVYI